MPLANGLHSRTSLRRVLPLPLNFSRTFSPILLPSLLTFRAIAHIQGMTDASSDCNCQALDMALAVSTSWILQGVNGCSRVAVWAILRPGLYDGSLVG